MTTDIVALQREYACLRQKQSKMHIIFTDVSADQYSGIIPYNIKKQQQVESCKTEDPQTTRTVKPTVEQKQTYSEFLDSITPQVIGSTKCILVQKGKAGLPQRKRKRRSSHGSAISASNSNISNIKELRDDETADGTHACAANTHDSETAADSRDDNLGKECDDESETETVLRILEDTLGNTTEKQTAEDQTRDVPKEESQDTNSLTEGAVTNVEDSVVINDRFDGHSDGQHIFKDSTNIDVNDKSDSAIKERDINMNCTRSVSENVCGDSHIELRNEKDEKVSSLNTSDSPAILPITLSTYTGRRFPGRLTGRSVSLNFEDSLKQALPNVSPDVAANIYHHFMTKKRHLSVDSASTIGQQGPSKIVNPFPVQHNNQNRLKTWVKLGLCKGKRPV